MMQDPTNYFNQFSEQIKNQITQTLTTISEYKVYFTEQARIFSVWVANQYGPIKTSVHAFMTWIVANIRAGAQSIASFLQHFPEYAKNTAIWLLQKVIKGFQKGCQAALSFIQAIPSVLKFFGNPLFSLLNKGYLAGRWLIQNSYKLVKSLFVALLEGLKQIGRFIQSFPALMLKLSKKLVQFIKEAFTFGKWVGKQLFYLAKALVKASWRLCKYIARNLGTVCKAILKAFYNFIAHIPQYLIQLKDFAIAIGKVLQAFAKEGFAVLRALAKFIIKNSFYAGKWILGQVFSKMAMGIGILYALSSALVDLIGSLLNNIVSSGLGLELAKFAIFENIKFGLSISLTALACYHIARFTYYGITTLVGLVAAHQLLPEQEIGEREPPRQRPEMDESAVVDFPIEHRYQVLTPLYHQRANEHTILDDTYRPLPGSDERTVATPSI